MWQLCIQKEPSLFQHLRNPTPEMCLLALEEDGNNLQYITNNKEITLTSQMCWVAVLSYPSAILDVPAKFRTERLKEIAFDREPNLMQCFDRIRLSYLRRKLKEQPSLIRYVRFATEQMWCDAIKQDPNICTYIKEFTPKIRETILEYHPSIAPMLPAMNIEGAD